MTEREAEERDDTFRVQDRRHWAQPKDEDEGSAAGADEPTSTVPTIVEQYRRRAEDAERKLLDYIAAFKQAQAEQDAFRERLARDVDRRVGLQFGALIEELLGCVDDLDLALAHASESPESASLARGVALARDRFLAALERQGVARFELDGEAFDPNVAEAVRVDPVESREQDGTVTRTLAPGYRLGERVLRPAKVAVGRLAS